MGELYGEENKDTKEWTDGLASNFMRLYTQDESPDWKWTVFDGPVDSLWIENMNTVLDDSMTLCLANGERMKLKNSMRMLFEVQDLAVASPATVSRCGMVYMTPSDLGWLPYVDTWLNNLFDKATNFPVPEEGKEELGPKAQLRDMFIAYIDTSLEFIKNY